MRMFDVIVIIGYEMNRKEQTKIGSKHKFWIENGKSALKLMQNQVFRNGMFRIVVYFH